MPSRRLRRSSSLRTARAKLTRRPTGVVRSSPSGSSRACGSLDRGPRDGQRLAVAEHRAALVEGERAQVEVVDGLLHQVVEVLDQPGPGVGVSGDTERVEHHRAELVGGRDRGRVEAGERVGHPPMTGPAPLVVPPLQEHHQLGRRSRGERRASRRVIAEHPLGLDQLGAHPLPQLLARRPAERDDEHLLEPGVPFGDVPRDQGTDGPGLAGPGAGLEQDRAGGQLRSDVEGLEPSRRRFAHRGATLSMPVTRGSQIRHA